MTDSDFKEWMKSEISELKSSINRLENKTDANAAIIQRYLWWWRAVRWTGATLAGLIVIAWEDMLRLISKTMGTH